MKLMIANEKKKKNSQMSKFNILRDYICFRALLPTENIFIRYYHKPYTHFKGFQTSFDFFSYFHRKVVSY